MFEDETKEGTQKGEKGDQVTISPIVIISQEKVIQPKETGIKI